MYAFLSGAAAAHRDKFFFASTEPIQSHAVKLNILGEIICHEAESDEDILIFIDGDAFPVADTENAFALWLKDSPLAAVQRLENVGDIQPHPSFCITTVGFWWEIGGEWNSGYCWETESGNVTDVGGNLLKQLADRGLLWFPILRSKNLFEHPLWYGVYGDLIYHHGAGFRYPISRLDKQLAVKQLAGTGIVGKLIARLFVFLNFIKGGAFIKKTKTYRRIIQAESIFSEGVYRKIAEGCIDG